MKIKLFTSNHQNVEGYWLTYFDKHLEEAVRQMKCKTDCYLEAEY